MAEKRIEYRFVLDAYTPETIPQARLAEYLADLAALYGEIDAVHFVRLEPSSCAIVSAIDPDEDPEVAERVQTADTGDAKPDAQRAFLSLIRRIREDGGSAYVARGTAKILTFPTGQAVNEPLVYGPFWQPGHFAGTVILIGGKSDPVSVKLQDGDGNIRLCKARRGIAKQLREYLYEQPIRATGRGKWFRDAAGDWRLHEFQIESFVPLDDESLAATITRLRSIDARWKDLPDPIAKLNEIRNGD
jgi:hypothetical protein